MPDFHTLIPFVPLLFLVFFAWRYFKNGSLVAALLGGRLTETVGEVSLASSGMTSRVLRVSLIANEGAGGDIALAIIAKAAFGTATVALWSRMNGETSGRSQHG
jgi:hypothetical protein